MTPRQQRNLLLAILAAGALIVITATLIALTRSRRDIQIAAPAHTESASDGFTFFDVTRTTVLDHSLRSRLTETLGSDAIAHATPIDLTIVDQAFMQAHLPDVDQLNQRLNPPLGARREHQTTRLTYLRAESHGKPFRHIELVFSSRTGRPLFFIIKPTEAFSDSIAALTAKYGSPRKVETDDRSTAVRIWKQEDDYLVATRFRRRNGRLAQDMRIYFMDNLQQLAAREEQARRRQDRSTRQAGESAF